ncbi:AI-2E family transporter [Halobacteriales archaeon QS_5_70_15]|nr:MAG: AI-2E family transporter [Halobacteriales archaeon QS_5_70_15]
MNRPDRDRIGWWLYVLVLAGAALFLAYSFVGILVLGLFGYYATRPICNRVSRLVDSDRIAALLTVLVVLLPILLVVLYASAQVVTSIDQAFGGTALSALATRVAGLDAIPLERRAQLLSVLSDPLSLRDALQGSIWSNVGTGLEVIQGVFGAILLLGLSITLSYALLERDDVISDRFVALAGGRDTTAYAYARAIDEDLESVFFGNLLFVIVMGVIATATYAATNLVAPTGLRVPMVLVLGFLTGLTSIIPIVVGKVVYLPVVALLAFQATGAEGSHLPFVGGVLLVYFLVLDFLPQSFIQPYISGQEFDAMVLVFAYILGPVLFGWYGFFLLPIVAVLILEAIRIVLPELVRGDPRRPEPTPGGATEGDPRDLRDDRRTTEETDSDPDGVQPDAG